MKIPVYPIWLILSLTMLCRVGYGQESSNNPPQQLKQQIRWLERQGFPARDYQWGDPEVNQSLRLALRAKEQADRSFISGFSLMGVGAGLTILGFKRLPGAVLGNAFSRGDNQGLVTLYGITTLAGIGAVTSGIVISVNGRNKKWEAEDRVLSAVRSYNN